MMNDPPPGCSAGLISDNDSKYSKFEHAAFLLLLFPHLRVFTNLLHNLIYCTGCQYMVRGN